MSATTRKKLSQNEQRWIVKRLSLNKPHKEIRDEFLKKFERPVSSVTLSRLRSKHLGVITTTQKALVEQDAIQAAGLKNKAYKHLERRLDQAEEDETEVEKLRRQWRLGMITRSEYEQAVRSYVTLSVSELTTIANMGHTHSKGEDDPNLKPTDRAALELMLEGIRSGNPVQLVQIMNPNAGRPREY